MGANQAKTALVTGASSGIGRELADLLAHDGYDLILPARQREALEGLAEPWRALGRRVDVLSADLSQPGGAQALYQAIKQQGIAVDILVNNAGFGTYGAFHDIELNKDLELLQINVVALTAL
ncbi:MAG TPA: SDR family NAD(P)-dependent oxidoreductase, partial [Polyangia bacterium]